MSADIGPGDVLICIQSSKHFLIVAGREYICSRISPYGSKGLWGPCFRCHKQGQDAIHVVGVDRWGFCKCVFRKRGSGEEIEQKLFKSKPNTKELA